MLYVPLRFISFCSILLLTCGLATVGCAIRLISDYDDVLDKDVTTLQQNTETFLGQLDYERGTPAAAFSANKDFYIKSDASLRTMATRAEAQPKSKVIVGEVQALENTFEDLKKLHQGDGGKGLSSVEIQDVRGAMETEFEAILTLELALKSHNGVPSAGLAPTKTK